MATLTLRGIDNIFEKTLKERAKQEGLSVNALVLKLLREATGLDKKKRTATHADLDHLAGTWSKEDAEEFNKAIAAFETVDEQMWQ